MNINKLTNDLSVSPQIGLDELDGIKAAGFRSIISDRPDGEAGDQPTFAEIEAAARKAGLEAAHVPVVSGWIDAADVRAFAEALERLPKPTLGFCRTGMRTTSLWAMSQGESKPIEEILATAKAAGYDVSGSTARIMNGGEVQTDDPVTRHQVVIVGGGAAGIATAASLLKRDNSLDIAIVDPAEAHYYQPGWTMVGGGIFKAEQTRRDMGALIPKGVKWIKAGVAAFMPDENLVVLEGCRTVAYERLIVAPGLKLDWDGIDGLSETLGKNGVTSNYRYDLAPYTWELVQGFKRGRALFTQPAMPIKCAGAPQKAMYLSCDHWRRQGVLPNIEVEFHNAGGVLFGVKEYVPALMEYVERYGIDLCFSRNLVAIDGPNRTATFRTVGGENDGALDEVAFDMIHVCPPQVAPDFVRASPLADAAGWVDVDQTTLRHKTYENVYGLGDATNTPNAKTAAAARKQAPIVAHNVLADMGRVEREAAYDGYGSCPLTVERGRIVLAEFGYGGKLLPSFPSWVNDGTRPSRKAWLLKERLLPPLYWNGMLKGRETLVKPALQDHAPAPKAA